MKTFTDEEMGQLLPAAKSYSVVILKQGPNFGDDTAPGIIWEHGRRNYALRAAGLLSIVCPIRDATQVAGIGIFNAEPAATEQILRGDPAVQAGVLTYEIHPSRSFPGDALPQAIPPR